MIYCNVTFYGKVYGSVYSFCLSYQGEGIQILVYVDRDKVVFYQYVFFQVDGRESYQQNYGQQYFRVVDSQRNQVVRCGIFYQSMTQYQNRQDVVDDVVSCNDVVYYILCIELEVDGFVVDFDVGVRFRRVVCDVVEVKDVYWLECVFYCRGIGENYKRKFEII